MERIVLDTNSLVQCIAPRNKYHSIWEKISDGEYYLCVSNSIICEYEEILTKLANRETAKLIISLILNSKTTIKISPTYQFELIQADPDDNKFVDCAICGNARCIVTNDHHFDILKTIEFPKVIAISIEEFYNECMA